jgi:hypothetical protein
MSQSITLAAFETIDARLSHLLRMGPFETCEWPRGYITASNRLLDACIDAMGYAYVDGFASAEECAAAIVTAGLLSSTFVVDAN